MPVNHTSHRRRIYLWATVLTVAAGLSVRYVPLGLPWIVMNYAGSALCAMMIYWVLALNWPRRDAASLAVIAAAIATLAEFSRLYHVGWLDAFRATLPGMVLLGRYFSARNIAAYWVAIAAAALLDEFVLRRRADTALIESK